jgi:hypothetical protein
MATVCGLISDVEKEALEERSIAAGTYRDGLYEPGMMWFCPWYHDPADPKDMEDGPERRERILSGQEPGLLSVHYWRDWWSVRAAITVVCPNGRQWCVDQKSNDGTGWTVTGDVRRITTMPSIVVPGYHGWLKDGVFSDDIEGRGRNGVKGS